MKRIGWAFLLPSGIAAFALAACRVPAPKPAEPRETVAEAPAPRFSAEIRRTSFGVPHVVAEDEAGIGYGIGYAYAQDNVCQFAEVIVGVNGERSRYFGPDATGGPDFESNGGTETNLENDFLFRFVNSPEHVQKAWEEQSAEAKELIGGFVTGFNRYLREVPAGQRPAPCRNAPWVRNLSEQDIVRFMRRLAVEASTARFTKPLLAAQPPGRAAGGGGAGAGRYAADLPDDTFPTRDAWRGMRESIGSNAIAFGKDATENGRGLLLGNPHYPWYGSLRFYQLHITIPGKVDVMGATIGGFPVVSIGFNRDLAWSHTVNTSMHFVIYALQLDPADPRRYVVDGQSRPLERKTVAVEVRENDGSVATRHHDFWLSEFGPLLVLSKEMPWSARRAYALHDANFSNNRMIETWYAMDRARSLGEMEGAITQKLGIPWVNTIAADSEGGTLYTDVTVVPHLTKEKQGACIAEPYRKLISRGLFVLEASGACRLEDAPGAPQSGVYAGSQLPVLHRSDFVQNSNDSAWMTNPAAPLVGYAPIVSTQDDQQDGRTRIGVTQVLARLAGRDGLAGNRFDAEKLKAIAFSNRSYFGTLLREDLLAVCKDAGSATVDGRKVDLAAACATFRSWDGHANLDSMGYPLADAWIRNLLDANDFWAVPFSKDDPINTPRGIKRGDPEVVKQVRAALASAVLRLEEEGVDPARPWSELQGHEVAGRRIPIPGGTGSGIYNVIWGEVKGGYRHVRAGASYVQIVSFDEAGPHAQGFLTYSQSTDPASPHFADQAPRFSVLHWIPQPYTNEEITRDPEYRTMILSE
jgi:acyl-homoserine-lactone acylase